MLLYYAQVWEILILKVMVAVTLTNYFFFLNLDFIYLRVPELVQKQLIIFSYRTNSTWWNLKSTKSYYGCIRKSSGYIIHSTEGNYFWRGKGTQQTFVLMKTSWRRLKDVFRFRLQKTSSRRLQDVFTKTNIFLLIIRLQKTSSRCFGQDQYIRLVHTSSRRLQSVCKTCRKYVLKTSSRRFEDVSSS